MSLPAGGAPYRVATVCLGNICRSPVAAVVLAAKLKRVGLADRVSVRSAGTGDWHVGGPMDPRASSSLQSAGYDGSLHRATQFIGSWYDDLDLILVMDGSNFRDVTAMAPDEGARAKVRMFREFDPEAESDDLDVPDPWYGGPADYALVLEIVERTTDDLVDTMVAELVDALADEQGDGPRVSG